MFTASLTTFTTILLFDNNQLVILSLWRLSILLSKFDTHITSVPSLEQLVATLRLKSDCFNFSILFMSLTRFGKPDKAFTEFYL
jgi:hypothetical protein